MELKQGGESVALFVSLTDGKAVLTSAQKNLIRQAIAKSATRHHVPKIMEQVGKIVELAVKNILHNRHIRNFELTDQP
jgi:acyl-coenzyme A synthetase/AMP-(fatty) acid ligase